MEFTPFMLESGDNLFFENGEQFTFETFSGEVSMNSSSNLFFFFFNRKP